MVKIKVIDLKTLVETHTNKEFTAYRDMTMGIIEGPKGVIMTDEEACHSIETDTNFEFQIALTRNNGENSMMPHSIASDMLANVLQNAPVTEMHLREYIRQLDNDLEFNYGLLLDSIREVGLNPNDFDDKQ